ncbi:velvet factor-domain-containing protein [Geopyxis carbonaria]|nr:velvet factor-domain-containing protein [Geopyxis carbonaria]
MMSPGPTPQPIYTPNFLPPSSTMTESPRPVRPTAFPLHHPLHPLHHGNSSVSGAPHFPGPALAPLALPNSRSGGPALPGQPPIAQQPSHLSPNHGPPHHPATQLPPQQSSSHQPNESRRPHSYLPHQPIYSSAPPSTFSPGSNNFGRQDVRRFSNETDSGGSRSSIGTMVSSPTFRTEEGHRNNHDGHRNSHDGHRNSHDGHRNIHDGHRNSSRRTSYSGLAPSVPAVDDGSSVHREVMPSRSPGRYQIEVRQQPVAARACGFGERDRRVIDPPPIVQLIANDPETGQSDPTEIRYPFNVVHCTLWSVDGTTDQTALVGVDNRLTRRLMGTLVSSPFVGLDEEGKEGCFFCFPDLSCRTHGKYRLRFVLMRLEPSALQPDGYTPIITETMSDVFQVYTAKEFPGMRPSTTLTKALKRQGCAISVKKGNEKAVGNAGGSGKDDGSGDDDTPSSSKSKRRRTKP